MYSIGSRRVTDSIWSLEEVSMEVNLKAKTTPARRYREDHTPSDTNLFKNVETPIECHFTLSTK